jgi:Ca-activated chloride channel family protein
MLVAQARPHDNLRRRSKPTMTFLWRDALWFLMCAPAVAAGYVLLLRRRRTRALRIPTLGVVHDALQVARSARRHVPPALLLLAVILLLASIARPAADLTLPHEQRMVILAIDVSYSMGATDVGSTRLAAAQAAAKAFVEAQPRDVRIGVLAFAGEADLVQVPTRDRLSTIAAIDHLKLQSSTAVGTGIIAALLTIFPESAVGGDYEIFGSGHVPVAEHTLFPGLRTHKIDGPGRRAAGSDTSTAVIVLTDGRTTMGPDPREAAQLAARRGIRIYTVGFGSTGGVGVDVSGQRYEADLDEPVLRDIAKRTHAEYFHAATAQELNDVYRVLTGRVVLERRETEIAALFAAVAAILTLASAGLSLAWSGRLI